MIGHYWPFYLPEFKNIKHQLKNHKDCDIFFTFLGNQNRFLGNQNRVSKVELGKTQTDF